MTFKVNCTNEPSQKALDEFWKKCCQIAERIVAEDRKQQQKQANKRKRMSATAPTRENHTVVSRR